MSNIFWKNFYHCFSKFKCLPEALSPPSPSTQDHNRSSALHPTTSTTIIKNFNSLYDLTSIDSTTSKSLTSSTDDFLSSSDESDTDSPPDFATVFASGRFFFSSPGSSNSIFESPESDTHVTGGVAIQTYSPDPYADFRRSMQEMIEARELMDVKANWEYLHELLSCYLTLNPKHTHKFITGAFADLLISLMSSTTSSTNHQSRRKPERRQQRAFSQRLV